MKVLYFVLSWACFSIGHIASKIMKAFDNSTYWVAFWYPIYNKYMLFSNYLQDKAAPISDKKWPWENA